MTPFERVIWNADQCAEYLGQEKATFLKRTQYLPGFPPRCPIPGQPRWKAIAVTEWAFTGKSERSRQIPANNPETTSDAQQQVL